MKYEITAERNCKRREPKGVLFDRAMGSLADAAWNTPGLLSALLFG